jgi:ATP-dependent Clp protease ATP-binding subunit ClpB
VRRRPYQVILFDEVEKAHPDVFNILLQVLDDGRLTDSHGRTVDFRNTLIVLTSNLGSTYIAALPEDQPAEAARDQVMAEVRNAFRPEFLNRLDEIILFHRLGRGDMTGIVEIQLQRLQALIEDRKIRLAISDGAKRWLADAGYDPVYGARPLKRAIQKNLQDPLARLILEGRIHDGNTVKIDTGDGGLLINGAAAAMAA